MGEDCCCRTFIFAYPTQTQQNKNFVAFVVGMWYNRGAKSFAAVRKTVLGAFIAVETLALYFLCVYFVGTLLLQLMLMMLICETDL